MAAKDVVKIKFFNAFSFERKNVSIIFCSRLFSKTLVDHKISLTTESRLTCPCNIATSYWCIMADISKTRMNNPNAKNIVKW